MSVCLSVSLSVSQSLLDSLSLSVRQSVCVTLSVSFIQSVSLSVCDSPLVYLCQSISLSVDGHQENLDSGLCEEIHYQDVWNFVLYFVVIAFHFSKCLIIFGGSIYEYEIW